MPCQDCDQATDQQPLFNAILQLKFGVLPGCILCAGETCNKNSNEINLSCYMLFLMLHVRLVNAVADVVFTCQWHLPHAVLNISHDIHERPRLLLRSELCQTLPTSSSQTQAACFQHFPLTEPVMGLHPLVPLRSLVRSPKNMAGL